jgi:hypothetical protein
MIKINNMFGLLNWFFSPVKLYGGDGGDNGSASHGNNSTDRNNNGVADGIDRSNAIDRGDLSGRSIENSASLGSMATMADFNAPMDADFSSLASGQSAGMNGAVESAKEAMDKASKTTDDPSVIASIGKTVLGGLLGGVPGLAVAGLKELGKHFEDDISSALSAGSYGSNSSFGYSSDGGSGNANSMITTIQQSPNTDVAEAQYKDLLSQIALQQWDMAQDDFIRIENTFDKIPTASDRKSIDEALANTLSKNKAKLEALKASAESSSDPKVKEILMSQYESQKVELTDINKIKSDILDNYQTKSIEQMFIEATVDAKGQLATITNEYVSKSRELGANFESNVTKANDEYVSFARQVKDNMGTADADIYARTKGENLAGISQAYQEAQKQQSSALARRGLAGSGVEASAVSNMYQGEARDKATAMSRSYLSAINQSDVRRQNQLGIAGQIFSSQYQTAQGVFNTGTQVESGIYGARTSEVNQNLANLGTAVSARNTGIAQSQNITGTAVQAQSAQQGVALQTQQLASNNAIANAQADAQSSAGIGTLIGTLGGAWLGSDSGSSTVSSWFS